jgi:hypothetical protein
MKSAAMVGLVALNLILVVVLIVQLSTERAAETPRSVPSVPSGSDVQPDQVRLSRALPDRTATNASTPFETVYSPRAGTFVENLRRVGCPEETIKDILMAEMNRRYRAQEETLRPKPADHVPWGWSSRTAEAKLLERRHQAAAIAREKESILRNALGYEVHVPMPLYAMTTSDRRFEEMVNSLPPKVHQAAYQTQEQYWTRVEQLRARTKGFWEPADVQELEQLKRERAEALEKLKEVVQ